jgi:hypothetical protein
MDQTLGTILIDITPGSSGEFDRSFLERNGHKVLLCHGPDEGTICPLLDGTGCTKVDEAHGIVFGLDLDVAQHREILERYRRVTAPEVPIRVVVRPGQAELHAALLSQFEVCEPDPTVADLDGFAAEVEAADRVT